MKMIKKIVKIFNSKIFIATLFFILGFLSNVYLVKKNDNLMVHHDDRLPVALEDFDHQKMLESLQRKNRMFGKSDLNDDLKNEDNRWFNGDEDNIDLSAFDISPKRKEDDHFVYYEIPIDTQNKENHLNVEVKDGLIHLKSDSKSNGNGSSMSSSMEQVFSIDANLEERKAEVINEKNKIVIKIPKRKAS